MHNFAAAGDNYIRVMDSIQGIGFENSRVPISQWAFSDDLLCPNFKTKRIQGIDWGQYERGYVHEITHWLGLNLPNIYPYQHVGTDGAHLPSLCTIHGPLQGPVWDYTIGFPSIIPYTGSMMHGDSAGCIIEPNSPDANGNITFHYEPSDSLKAQQHSKLMLYFFGLIPAEEVTETYYCLYNDGSIDDSDINNIKANYGKFTIIDVIAKQGRRVPAFPKVMPWSIDSNLRVGSITMAYQTPTEAEMAWWTIWNRHFEDDTNFLPYPPAGSWGWGMSGWNSGFVNFKFTTGGKSIVRTKLAGIACRSTLRGSVSIVPYESASCNSPDDPVLENCTSKFSTARPSIFPTTFSPTQVPISTLRKCLDKCNSAGYTCSSTTAGCMNPTCSNGLSRLVPSFALIAFIVNAKSKLK